MKESSVFIIHQATSVCGGVVKGDRSSPADQREGVIPGRDTLISSLCPVFQILYIMAAAIVILLICMLYLALAI